MSLGASTRSIDTRSPHRAPLAALLVLVTVLPTGHAAMAAPASAGPAAGTLSLGDAYREALRRSEQVEIGAENRALAETSYTGALTIMGPTVNIGASAVYQNRATVPTQDPSQAAIGVQNPYSWAATATANIPLFRRQIFEARRAARLGIAGADEQLKRIRQQLMFDVTTLFISVLQARQQIGIAQAAVKRAETQVTSAVARIKVGGALPAAELLARVELNRGQVLVNNAVGALRTQESAFERLVGVPPPAELILPPPPPRATLLDGRSGSRDNRPDVRALRYATLQARVTVEQLQGRIFWPTIDLNLSAGYRVLSTSNGNPQDVRYPTYGMLGVVNFPLFQTGDEWIQVKLQRQRVGIAAFQESFLRRQVDDDIRQALARLETAETSINIATEQQKNAQKYYDMVSGNFARFGVGSILDVVTAQAAVFEAETNKALAAYERELASYQMLFAEGKIDL